jgi:hypothetical protein
VVVEFNVSFAVFNQSVGCGADRIGFAIVGDGSVIGGSFWILEEREETGTV